MRSRFWLAAASASLLAFGGIAALGDDEPKGPLIGGEKAAAAAGEAKAESKKDKPKRFPDFAEVTKDMKADEGLFTVYRYDPNDKDKDPEKVLLRIPKALLKEDLLFATSISSGGPLTGFQGNDWLVRGEVLDKNFKLVTPDTRFITRDDKTVADVIKRTYGESYLASVPIVTLAPGGDPVIDLGALLKSDIAGIDFGVIRPDLSKFTKIKVFPENVLVEVELAMQERGSKGGSGLGISYAFQKLPKGNGYKSRVADQRVGYFGTTRVDWAKAPEARDTAERYINRWQLEKKDSSLEVSPPKKPIVFIIEKTVPIQWRRWVRQGIAEWNKAYEKIGFVDAVVVQQQTDDNEYAEYDPEDARYSFFRWIVSGRAFAMGPSRPDPRTGQIIDADIIFDDSFVRAWMTSQFDIFTPPAVARENAPWLDLYLERYPELAPHFLKDPFAQVVDRYGAERDTMLREWSQGLHRGCTAYGCDHADGMSQQLALMNATMLATASGKKIPERLIGQAIAEVVTHEVGHTLGLRHNFKASAWLSLEEARKRRDTTDDATTASVMDYNPLMFFADDELDKLRHVISPTIGPYDEWAIEYGYKIPGKEDKGEEEMLKAIASRHGQPGLEYNTDEDTMGVFSPDPYVNRYDFSNSQLDWVRARIALGDKLIGTVLDWAAKDGEPRYYITQAFNIVLSERVRNFGFVARLIGGISVNRDYKGDSGNRPAFQPIDGETQRAALKLMTETLFNDQFFKVAPEVLNNLAVPRWADWATNPPLRVDYPIHERITMMQMMPIVTLLSPPTLQRLYDSELKSSDPKKFTTAELIVTLRDSIWATAVKPGAGPYSDAQPMVSSVSRNLQREHLNLMLALAQASPGAMTSPDVNGMIRQALRELSAQMGAVLSGKNADKLDFATRAHLTESKSRIDRVLDAQFQAR